MNQPSPVDPGLTDKPDPAAVAWRQEVPRPPEPVPASEFAWADLVLIRGLPGAGKSSIAGLFIAQGYVHVEADQFFIREGRYVYERELVPLAHEWCREQVRESLRAGRRVVVSNTFVSLAELEPYLRMRPDALILEASGPWQNVHDVPESTLARLLRRWEHLPPNLRARSRRPLIASDGEPAGNRQGPAQGGSRPRNAVSGMRRRA